MTTTPNRIVRGLPAAQYHADRSAISKHWLDELHVAPARYKWKLANPERERTAALRWGTLLDSLMFDGAEHVVCPAPAAITSKQQKAWKEFAAEAESQGREAVTASEWEALCGQRESMLAHPASRALLTGDAEFQQSVFWEDEETGILCRGRPDSVTCRGIVADLKTTEDASPAAFARSCATYRYHVQAAMYLDGLRRNDADIDVFSFIAVEKEPPYLTAVYAADDIFLSRGREEYRADLRTFARCLETDTWPGYPPTIQPISLPAWALKNQN
jgi:hypothetical protein